MQRAPKQHTPTPIDGAFGYPSLQRRKNKKSPRIVPKTTIFLVFMNKTQISLFALPEAELVELVASRRSWQ